MNLMTNTRASSDPGNTSFVPAVTALQWFVSGKFIAIYMQIWDPIGNVYGHRTDWKFERQISNCNRYSPMKGLIRSVLCLFRRKKSELPLVVSTLEHHITRINTERRKTWPVMVSDDADFNNCFCIPGCSTAEGVHWTDWRTVQNIGEHNNIAIPN